MFHTIRSCSLAPLAVAWMALVSNRAEGTILTFEVGDTANSPLGKLEDPAYHADYGDDVNNTTVVSTAPNGPYTYGYGVGAEGFTPNVVVGYSHDAGAGDGHSSNLSSAFLGYVDYLHYEDGVKFWITFTPDSGFAVQVNSFLIEMHDVTNFPSLQSLTPDVSWALYQNSPSGTLITSGAVELAYDGDAGYAAGDDEFENVTTSAAAYAGPVVLEFSFTGTGDNGLIAIDNVNFGQIVIPEPSSLTILGIGMVGLLARRRRMQR